MDTEKLSFRISSICPEKKLSKLVSLLLKLKQTIQHILSGPCDKELKILYLICLNSTEKLNYYGQKKGLETIVML